MLRAAAFAVLLGACFGPSGHVCAESSQCPVGGACETNGYCSRPEPACPSGRAYGEGAPGSLAGSCVLEVAVDGGLDAEVDAAVDAAPDAAPVAPRFGTGRDGDVTLVATTTSVVSIINSCAPIDFVDAGDSELRFLADPTVASIGALDLTGFPAGSRAILWRPGDVPRDDANIGSDVAPDLLNAGRYDLVEIAQATVTGVVLTAPLSRNYRSAQLCRVPEFGRVTMSVENPAAVAVHLRAAPWNGATGGLVAMMVSEELALLGGDRTVIQASGTGYRGGPATTSGLATNCAALVGTSADGGGARKGEGLVPDWFTTPPTDSGRGRGYHAGGGGDCIASGGGGGGGAGAGGGGGVDLGARAVGGQGGVGLASSPRIRLLMGGGGGAGEGVTGSGVAGGAGGGVVWVAARAITSSAAASGTIRANGVAGTAGVDTSGGGGGGGGGTVYIDTDAASELVVSAIGGNGGRGFMTTFGPSGPGGGGGGGRVLAIGRAAPSSIATAGGQAGVSAVSSDGRGAMPGSPGDACLDGCP